MFSSLAFFFFLGISCLFLLPRRKGASGILIVRLLGCFSECHFKENQGSVSSVAQSCPTLCDPMDCSTPGFPVHHQLLELAQTHVRRVGDAIQPCPLSVVPFIREPVIRAFQTSHCGPGERPLWHIGQNRSGRRHGLWFVFVAMLYVTAPDLFLFPHKIQALCFPFHEGPNGWEGLEERCGLPGWHWWSRPRLPVQETRVRSLGQEHPLEEGMATHSSIPCLENPTDGGAWRATVHGAAEESDTILAA